MNLQFILPTLSQNRRIAPRLGEIQHHRLIKEVEPIDLINGIRSRLNAVEDDKCLALGLQIGLRDDVNDVAIFREDFLKRFFQLVDFDSFFEVADLVESWVLVSVHLVSWRL